MTLDELRALLEVIETGSINRAAAQLGMPRTTLTRRLDALEAEFGAPLLTTSRDGSTPTDVGARLARGAKGVLRQVAELDAAVRFELETPSRPVKLAIPPGIAPTQAAIFLDFWRQQMPGIQLQVYTQANPFLHGVDREPDLIVSFGRPRLGDYRVFQMLRMRFTFKASSVYLAEHGTPTTIEELRDHPLWVWEGALMTSGEGTSVLLREGKPLRISPAMVLDDVHLLHTVIHRGSGLAIVPSLPYTLSTTGAEPDEVELLEGTLGADVGLWVAVPERNAELAWMRRLINILREFSAQFETHARATTSE